MDKGIYFLHSGDYKPRYVGLTTQDFDLRLRQHKIVANGRKAHNTYKANWIKSIGGKVFMHPLEITNCDVETLRCKEAAWIKSLKDKGCRLTNLTEGGENGNTGHRKLSKEETKSFLDEYLNNRKDRYNVICNKYNISTATGNSYAKRAGLSLRNNFTLNQAEKKEVSLMYNTGNYTQKELANIFGVTSAVIQHVVGVKGKAGSKRTYSMEFATEIVEEYLKGGISQDKLAAKHNIRRGTVKWFLERHDNNNNKK